MPGDTASPLYLSRGALVHRPPPDTCKPALRFQRCAGQMEDGRPARTAKKQVTFADHRGMSLTKVKTFSEFSDPTDVPLSVRQVLSSALTTGEDELVLDFPQPASDYLRFRQSLETNYVCLEHCVLKERALAGTVKVKNVSYQKRVALRVSFDRWGSHADVDCEYVKPTQPGSCCDTFSFHLALPRLLQPHGGVEFAVCYRVAGHEYWDSNRGRNYRVVWASVGGGRRDAGGRCTDSFGGGFHCERYGLLPDWPGYAAYGSSGPYC